MTKEGHPRGLYLLFSTEMWERFSYYGMRAIFTLFLIGAMSYDKEAASEMYGNYTGLVYLTPLIGGYIADNYWGNKRSIIVGGTLMALGQFFLFLCASFLGQGIFTHTLLILGLGLLVLGNGFFKPNISSMVGTLYPDNDPRKDSAYTIFYMGINFGAFFSPLVCGFFGVTGDPADFKYGFLAACVGMIIGVVSFLFGKDKYLVTPEGEEIGGVPRIAESTLMLESHVDETSSSQIHTDNSKIGLFVLLEVLVFGLLYWLFDGDYIGALIYSLSCVVPVYIITDKTLVKEEKRNILVIYILAFFVVFFWAAFEQAGASLTYFAEEQTDRFLPNFFDLDLTLTRKVISIVIFTALSVGLTKLVGIRLNKSFDLPTYLSVIIFAVTISFIFFSSGEEVNTSYFGSLNPIFIIVLAPVMSSLWMTLEGKNIHIASPTKQAIGLALLSFGYFFIAYGVDDVPVGEKVSMMWITTLYLVLSIGELSLSPIGLSMVNKLSPARFASLLMSVWLLSSATANKFAGVLSALYPEANADGIVVAKSFCGYEIANLHDFFMVFAVMSGVASFLLFLICRWINKNVKC
ncbi:MAG: peptide MFS transporter [Bacteroidales bacterium]|jgi:POT family proton-dependent oligopeptide transporter|nr:peptide MFS transporter [Bacteroidales bacterium]